MSTVIAWPPDVPATLTELYPAVADRLGLPLLRVANLDGLDGRRGDRLIVTIGTVASADAAAAALRSLEIIGQQRDLDSVLVVGDGYLGTDAADLGTAVAGAAVSTVRSAAVRRGCTARANVVCVPDALFGRHGSQRGPLATEIGVQDVVEAAVFLLGDAGRYLSGQVLFVNGGRQLFSSMSS